MFLIAGLAETRRIPFDLPEAESELVAGYHTEYSGMKFGMFFVGEYLGITLISALIVTLFFGGWLGPVLPGFVWFLLKTFAFIAFFILVRAAFRGRATISSWRSAGSSCCRLRCSTCCHRRDRAGGAEMSGVDHAGRAETRWQR